MTDGASRPTGRGGAGPGGARLGEAGGGPCPCRSQKSQAPPALGREADAGDRDAMGLTLKMLKLAPGTLVSKPETPQNLTLISRLRGTSTRTIVLFS